MIPDTRNPSPTPESIILDILSRKTRLTKELYEFFQKKYGKSMTLQGFYKIIKQLTKNRILVKENGLISIDVSWIHSLDNFNAILKQTYLQSESTLANILLNEGEEKTFTFEKVIDMDNFWNHALISVVHYYQENKHSDKNVYNYNHHCWFQVVRTHSEQALGQAYQQMGMKWYLAGAKTFLDKLVTQNIDTKNFYYTQTNTGEIVKPNYYVVVIGDFIFETALPKYIYDLMENIYAKTTNISEFNASDIVSLINQPGRTSLTISRDKKRAGKLRGEIKKLFKKK